MTTTLQYALMAGDAYRTTRSDLNLFPIPGEWTPFFAVPDLSVSSLFPAEKGFEALSFQRGSEIVISFAGTYDKSWHDNLTNAGLAAGIGATQLQEAAEYYLQVKAANAGASITLTGHSLGGGLASLIGVFFGVETTTFDQAPFANSAYSQSAPLMDYLRRKVDASGNRIYADTVLAPLANFIAQQQANGTTATLIPNSGLVTNIAIQGEFLSGAPWTVFGRIGTTVELISNTAPGVSGFDLHSQALLTAYLQSRRTAASGQSLNEVTAKLNGLLKEIFDSRLYAYRSDDPANRNFLDHVVRHEAGGVGGITVGGDGMLTHLTADLNKLGTDIAGLNRAAQDALIAQGIEWYYWQSTDYAGQEFFTVNGDLLQYTPAQGAGLVAAINKAATYVDNWLTPLFNANNEFGGNSNFGQWSVVAGSDGATALARDSGKSQIFVGNAGTDNFSGGDEADALFGDAGNDTLDGGGGRDSLMGGAGVDAYQFTGTFGRDTIADSDGNGSIVLDSVTLSGGKNVAGNVWESVDRKVVYTIVGGNLIIGSRGAAGSSKVVATITVNGWDAMQGNRLGITTARC